MKERKNENLLPPAYEGVERQLMAVFYSGVYITNADIAEVGKRLGLELPLKDRMALLKQLMRHAHDHGSFHSMSCNITYDNSPFPFT